MHIYISNNIDMLNYQKLIEFANGNFHSTILFKSVTVYLYNFQHMFIYLKLFKYLFVMS